MGIRLMVPLPGPFAYTPGCKRPSTEPGMVELVTAPMHAVHAVDVWLLRSLWRLLLLAVTASWIVLVVLPWWICLYGFIACRWTFRTGRRAWVVWRPRAIAWLRTHAFIQS